MRVNLGISFGFASWLRIVQVAAIPFVFISVTTAAYFGIPRELNNQVAGLINFARNIGGSILISLTNAFVTESTAFHQANFLHSLNPGNPVYQQRLQALTERSVPLTSAQPMPQPEPPRRFIKLMQAQTAAQAYVDVYFALAAASAIMVLLIIPAPQK